MAPTVSPAEEQAFGPQAFAYDMPAEVLQAEDAPVGGQVIRGKFPKSLKPKAAGAPRTLKTAAAETRLAALRLSHAKLADMVSVLEAQVRNNQLGATEALRAKKREKCKVKTEIVALEHQLGITPQPANR